MRKFQHGHRWGCWTLDACRLVLVLQHRAHRGYEVDLERALSFAEIGDWLLHVRSKAWPSEIANALLAALADICPGIGDLWRGASANDLWSAIAKPGSDDGPIWPT